MTLQESSQVDVLDTIGDIWRVFSHAETRGSYRESFESAGLYPLLSRMDAHGYRREPSRLCQIERQWISRYANVFAPIYPNSFSAVLFSTYEHCLAEKSYARALRRRWRRAVSLVHLSRTHWSLRPEILVAAAFIPRVQPPRAILIQILAYLAVDQSFSGLGNSKQQPAVAVMQKTTGIVTFASACHFDGLFSPVSHRSTDSQGCIQRAELPDFLRKHRNGIISSLLWLLDSQLFFT